jgi:AmmeMemoRadiSam system protein B/AmmeMemoRadiSam system protein A
MQVTRKTAMRSFVLVMLLLATVACGGTPSVEPTATSGIEAQAPLVAAPMLDPADVHRAEGAGRWYPSAEAELWASVNTYVSQAQVEQSPGKLVAVIVPHAGYIYSGAVAGHAYRAMQQAGCADYTLAVIGDTHTGNGSAQIAVWPVGAFETPLGMLRVDEAVAQALVAADERIEFDRTAFQAEHPVENQLPFIQVVCPGARIVPVVIREPSLENAQILANGLVAALREGERPAMIVASTDLSHYHPYEEARRMDEVALQAIVSLEPQAVIESPRRCAELGLGGGDPVTMCSQGAVMTALVAARQMGADRGIVLHYATSGDTPIGERSQVVGYGAVALWQTQSGQTVPAGFQVPPLPLTLGEPLSLSNESQKTLLTLARRTIVEFLATETFPPFHTDDPALLQPMGAYVTYEKAGGLRGCLGRLEGDRPAYLNVQYAAVAAALADSRFPAVTPDELEQLTLEITLLEPLRQVVSPEEIRIGRDGVLMRVGENAGALFLPQVPLEQGWDLGATLTNLCRKAGLPDDAWQRSDARFYTFGGQWFGESE